MGCVVSSQASTDIPFPPVSDYDFLCATAKQRLDKVPKLNTEKSFFYSDRSHRLWKMRKNHCQDDLLSTYHNNFRVFLLPYTNLILKPLGVFHVKTGIVAITMERAQTDMFELVQRGTDFEVVTNGLVQIANAIAWLHEHGLAHRDVKPENIVLHEGRFKLIDFDFCSPLEEFTHCGTQYYMCSKSVTRKWNCSAAECSKRADVYAFGKTILFVLWHASRQKVISYPEKPLCDMFYDKGVTTVELTEPWQHWLSVVLKCSSGTPPVKIPLLPLTLPLTIGNTLTAVNPITIPTTFKMVDADPTFT